MKPIKSHAWFKVNEKCQIIDVTGQMNKSNASNAIHPHIETHTPTQTTGSLEPLECVNTEDRHRVSSVGQVLTMTWTRFGRPIDLCHVIDQNDRREELWRKRHWWLSVDRSKDVWKRKIRLHLVGCKHMLNKLGNASKRPMLVPNWLIASN